MTFHSRGADTRKGHRAFINPVRARETHSRQQRTERTFCPRCTCEQCTGVTILPTESITIGQDRATIWL